LRQGLPALLEKVRAELGGVVVLASGDPLRSGVGSTLIGLLGADQVRISPALSSSALARARMGWSAEDVEVISLVGRSPQRVRRQLSPGTRLVVFCSDGDGPANLAGLLTEEGLGASMITAWWHLGGTQPGIGLRAGGRRGRRPNRGWAGTGQVGRSVRQ
jgi:precorrin-6Y C5,15-methyltransferase (decarboxylating)